MNIQITNVNAYITVQPPNVINSVVSVSTNIMGWTALQYGSGNSRSSLITAIPPTVQITSAPTWLTMQNSWGTGIVAGMSINSGDTISVFPTSENLGAEKNDYIVFSNSQGDVISIRVIQAATLAPPPGVPVGCSVLADPNFGGLTIIGYTAVAKSLSNSVMIDVDINVF